MTESGKAKYLAISPARAMVLEIMHHARKVPLMPLHRRCNIASLQDCRSASRDPVSWFAIFLKALGLVAKRRPELRRAYLSFPRAHLYEHPHSVGSFLVERAWQGETVILGAHIRAPEDKSLRELQNIIRYYQNTPIEDVSLFRRWLRTGRFPKFVRRSLFHFGLNLSGKVRAKQFGTFVLSSLGNMGVEQGHPLTPLTSYASFGPIDEQGDVTTTLVYDHRVMDGRDAARCLVDLEQVLNEEMVCELREGERMSVAS